MKPSEVVGGAIEVLKKYGWIQGSYGSVETGHCLYGALAVSCFEGITAIETFSSGKYDASPPFGKVEERVQMVCKEQYGYSFIDDVNDSLRTADEAISILEKAQIGLQEEGQ